MTDKLAIGVSVFTGGVGFVIHPYAAIGAAFGCCFYLAAAPVTLALWRKIFYCLFSYGIGYGVGAYYFPLDQVGFVGAWMLSAGVSALAAVIFGGLHRTAEHNGPLPPWLVGILDRVPFLKRGGSDNG